MSLHNSFIHSTIACSGNKEVDLDALNLVASGVYDCLCACSYANEKGHHQFVYDTTALTPFVHIRAGLTFEEYVTLLEAGLSVIKIAQSEDLVLDNLRLSKEYIFCTPNGYRFVYIPITRRSHVHIKEIVMKLISVIHIKDERISRLTKDIRKAKSDLQILELLETFVRAFTVIGSLAEEETSLLNSIPSEAIPMFGESETTLLSQTVAETEESETTLLSQTEQDRFDEGELGKAEHLGITSERLTAFLQDDSSEYETTVLTSQPQEAQRTVITGQNSAFLLSLVRNSSGEKIAVEITPFTIGKDRHSVDYVLDSDSVSRHHATIIFEDGNYYIIDNGSTNGTMIEGIRLQPDEKAELGNGYIISVGNETFQALLERR